MQKKVRKRRKRVIDGIMGILLSAVILLVMAWNVLAPDKELSVEESRVLAQRPKLSINSLLSGEFMEKYDAYLSDQFAGRNLWRNLRVAVGRISGERQENGVVLGDGGQLFDIPKSPNQETLTETLAALGTFAEGHSEMNVYMMLVPDAATVLTSKRPYLAAFPDQNPMITQVKRGLSDSVKWIDVTEILGQHSEEKIYYQTDKHWTSLGAYYAFSASAEQLGISGGTANEYAAYPITTTFNGELSSKSGYCLDVREEIDIYVPKGRDNDVVVNYVDEQRKTTSLYDSSCLEGSDQYEVFLGGDTSVIDIRTASENSRRLLIVKDSFANCFIPFLAPHFREIVVVDPHYYSGTLQELLGTYRISDVLFLYSGNGFFQDNSLSGVLGNG